MFWRRINIKRLVGGGVFYRLFIIVANTIFFRIITGDWKIAIKGSLLWNSVNVTLYYLYHYCFFSSFKLGEER